MGGKIHTVTFLVQDIIFAVVALTAGLVSFFAWGHAGVVAITMGALALMTLYDSFQLYTRAQGKVLGESGGVIPQSPDLPAKWYAVVSVLELAAIFFQLVTGLTLISALIMSFLYAGCDTLVHLFFYSGTLRENALTLLPEIALTILAWTMVLTAPLDMPGHMNLERSAEAMWLAVMIPTGALVGYLFLLLLGVSPKAPNDELQGLHQGSQVFYQGSGA